jgi:hypothetical protein
MEIRKHWETVYNTKGPDEVSWTQAVPQTSLDFIQKFNLPHNAPIIDIGGGDSRLVDYLLQDGYTDITVLDISEYALERAKNRLGQNGDKVDWIVSDIVEFVPAKQYSLWHDRATFHFLTTSDQIDAYLQIAAKAVEHYLILGTFSKNGPEKCSGLPIKQYSEIDLLETFAKYFKKIDCITLDHLTPFHTIQNFTFCSFERNNDETSAAF